MAYTSPLAEELAPGLLDRLTRYCRVWTTSDPDNAEASPSTARQLDLGRLLADELRGIGLEDVVLDEHGYVTGTLPATVEDAPTVGLLAHVDTSPDAPGEGVEPLVWQDWDGSPLRLPRGGTVVVPEGAVAGDTIVTGSGDTLLGADDKAGVAEIMSAVAWLAEHPSAPRPTVRVAFTPDEEIGAGAALLDIKAFGADCAYTLDGSDRGHLEAETFTGVAVTVELEGVDIHPGHAYGTMVNATLVAGQVLAALPADRLTPATTRGRDGFIHVVSVTGDAVRCTIKAIVRDFEDVLRDAHVALLRTTVAEVVEAHPGARVVSFDVVEQYPNMRDFLEPHPVIVDAAAAAYRAEGIEPEFTAARGGTDGSQLSARGLPTPNLFTGGHAYHSVREWASLHDMAAASAVIVHLAEAWTAPERRAFRLKQRP